MGHNLLSLELLNSLFYLLRSFQLCLRPCSLRKDFSASIFISSHFRDLREATIEILRVIHLGIVDLFYNRVNIHSGLHRQDRIKCRISPELLLLLLVVGSLGEHIIKGLTVRVLGDFGNREGRLQLQEETVVLDFEMMHVGVFWLMVTACARFLLLQVLF